jgi:drug/metabolite transporter (DMT)-like permease
MPVYVFYAFAALLFLGSSTILFKFTAKHKIGNSLVFYFYYMLIYFLLGLLIPLVKPVQLIPADLGALTPVILNSVTVFAGYYFFFSNIYKLDITTFMPLYNFRNIFSPVLAMIFLGETISAVQAPWFLLIVAAGFFVGVDEKMSLRSFFQRPILTFLIYVFSLSVSSIFVNRGVAAVGYWNFLFYIYVSGFILALIFLLPRVYREIKITFAQFWVAFAGVLFEFVGVALFVKALSYNVTISTVVLSLPIPPIITYIISCFKPDLLEHRPVQVYLVRFAAMVAMFVATVMLIVG